MKFMATDITVSLKKSFFKTTSRLQSIIYNQKWRTENYGNKINQSDLGTVWYITLYIIHSLLSGHDGQVILVVVATLER